MRLHNLDVESNATMTSLRTLILLDLLLPLTGDQSWVCCRV